LKVKEKAIIRDIRSVLEFYRALGFERLPIKAGIRGQGLGIRETGLRDKGLGIGEKELTPNPQLLNPVFSMPQSPTTKPLKLDALKELREEIGDCKRCKLSKGRKNLVFGEGSVDAEIMFIGEGPGKEEDLQGRPFVGEAGQLLTRLIEKMGFKRGDVYIGNIVKCRPPLNRDPEEDEINTCIPFIKKQVEIISPKVIVSLGRISAQALVGVKIPISKMRGRFFEFCSVPLMPTFHPAYLLRNPKDKWLVWEDAQKVLEKLKK
jgi:DNA polymerase